MPLGADEKQVVYKIAWMIHRKFPNIDVDDIIQQGMVVAVEMSNRFAGSGKAKLTTYLYNAIYKQVLRFCAASSMPVSGDLSHGIHWIKEIESVSAEQIMDLAHIQETPDSVIDRARAYGRVRELLAQSKHATALQARMLGEGDPVLMSIHALKYEVRKVRESIKFDRLLAEYMS